MSHERSRWTVGRCTSTIESKAHDYAGGVDVVSPEELKAQLNLGQIRVRIGVWADRLHCAVPDAVC